MARTELPHGIILPAEYSDDWYDDMTSNLSKLDEVIGSDADKLSAEDVGAAALSNDYTDLDNKPALKPVATSGDYDDLDNKPDLNPYDQHLANTDIHVTTADKQKWNNGVSQAYVVRYASVAVSDNSTVPYTDLNNTDNIKANDLLLDTNGKLYQISSVDTANETVSVTTPLTQLAVDANVMHLSGNETVIGNKRFGGVQSFTGYPSIRLYSADDDITVLPSSAQQRDIRFTDKNNAIIAYFIFQHRQDANEPFRTCWRQNRLDGTSNYYSVNFNNLGEFYPENYNSIKLGKPNNRWLGVYAVNYYYGANDVEFSTKFVTSDTDQSVSGKKVFTDINAISNSAELGSTAGNNSFNVLDKNKNTLLRLEGGTFSTGAAYSSWLVNNGTDAFNGVSLYQPSANSAQLRPYSSTLSLQLGASNRYFSDCYTSKINGLTPSSLSMPSDRSARVDISGYFTNMASGDTNTYTAPSNGYIFMDVTDCVSLYMYSQTTGGLANYGNSVCRNTIGKVVGFLPVRKDDVFVSQWYTTATNVTLTSAFFIPCQGNI